LPREYNLNKNEKYLFYFLFLVMREGRAEKLLWKINSKQVLKIKCECDLYTFLGCLASIRVYETEFPYKRTTLNVNDVTREREKKNTYKPINLKF